ncbi:conjugative transfer signal peptidase TraF [Rhizobium sp. P40RR-XXII]|uniref:conjugative transfer signal peptidase TraF n=1 Tax=unclassified Rhizobium TaxID=2613769 RepID=UPI0014575133|nr:MULTISPECIES: conjugative transfer signal peptidase TraF [unclassified Rhizobium]NLR85443.1 conjugative transfer signal peptidase TraF [Rhizobium sp. P28RR-XV]NLS21269.1 conjugative transfer signal peptidase TraF [Rhizobium sp. P40RR-XXII]
MTQSGVIPLLGAALTIMSGVVVAGWIGDYRLNLTPSEPLGLWRIERPDRLIEVGDLVFICPPVNPLFEKARQRGYLRHGLCAGGFAPLIKTVAALPGQRVEIGESVVIDGHLLARSVVLKTDGEGRAITSYLGGVVPPGTLFLHSSFASSYDSRYFGPIPGAGLLGLARPIFTYDP